MFFIRLENALSRISLAGRVAALVVLVAIGTIGLFIISASYIEKAFMETHISEVQDLVESAYSLLEQFEREVENGTLSVQEAQKMAMKYISGLRYGKNGYFWVIDTKGNYLIHPAKDAIRKNFYQEHMKHGKDYTKEFIESEKVRGSGVDTCYWPPDNGREKLSYLVRFPKWSWIIGSGIYLDDIRDENRLFIEKMILAYIAFFVLLVLTASALAKSVSKSVIHMNSTLQRVALGDLDVEIKEIDRKDEIGEMARTVQVFVDNARRVKKIDQEKEALDKTKSDLVSVVSHELRTPVTAIVGSLGLVLGNMKDQLPEKAVNLLTIAHNNCERLTVLINDLLDVDKTTSGQMKVTIAPEKLKPLLNMSAENNAPYAKKYHVKIECRDMDEDITVNVDHLRFLQIMSNFLSNAIKFSPAGGTVLIGAKPINEFVRISVIDHGLGIPKAFQEKLFEKFSQADSSASRQKGGTGLGLFITKSLVELMGGRVGFESTEGYGTTFWFELPLEKTSTTIAGE